MDYHKAFTFFAKKQPKSGWNNLLFGAVCQLIPIVGPMVFFGYRLEVARDLEDDPEMLYHRDFDFNRFGEYLGTGVWVFVLQFAITVFAVTIGIAAALFMALVVAAGQPPEIRLLLGLIGYLFAFLVLVGAYLFIWPMECHLAMSGRFRIGECFGFASRFLALMWGKTLAAVLVYFVATFVLLFIGSLLCIIGVYPAVAILYMAEGHIITQLYRQYLERGGEPIRRYAKDEDEDEGN